MTNDTKIVPSMNIENLKSLRDHIEAEDLASFSMQNWRESFPGCGTAACIGGTAEIIMQKATDDTAWVDQGEIAAWLGITYLESENLFFMHGASRDLLDVSRDDALKVLDSMIAGQRFTNWDDYLPEGGAA